MRKLKVIFCAVAAFLGFSVSHLVAQIQTTHAPTAAASTTPALHSLWKAQGQSNTVYLLGSIHLLRQTDYPLPQVMENAFSNSQVAVFEVDMEKAEDPMESMRLIEKSKLPDGQTLEKVLPARIYASFTNHMASAGLPMMIVDTMRPGMAVMMLEAMELTKLGADPSLGPDDHYFKLAKQTNRKTVALETVDFQVDLLLGFAGEDEELMVEKSLEQIDDEKMDYEDMVAAWKKGDSAALEKMLNEMRQEAPQVFKKMVSDRTASWVPKVDELLHGSQNAIVIVGAGHLIGADGLVELLKKKGVKVTQM